MNSPVYALSVRLVALAVFSRGKISTDDKYSYRVTTNFVVSFIAFPRKMTEQNPELDKVASLFTLSNSLLLWDSGNGDFSQHSCCQFVNSGSLL